VPAVESGRRRNGSPAYGGHAQLDLHGLDHAVARHRSQESRDPRTIGLR
jgi:hypothetical protein